MMRAFGSYLNNSNGFENINEIEWINEIPRVDSVQNIYIPMGAHELLQCSVSNMSCLPPKALFKNNFGNSKSRNPWYISDNPYIQNPWRLVRRYSYKNHCRSRLIRAPQLRRLRRPRGPPPRTLVPVHTAPPRAPPTSST